MFSLGSFPEVAQKQKNGGGKKKKKKKLNDRNNNGQLWMANVTSGGARKAALAKKSVLTKARFPSER